MTKADVLTEKRKIKWYFLLRFLLLLAFAFLYTYFVYRYLFTAAPAYPAWDIKIQEALLPFIPAVLVFIAAFVFVIPETAGAKEYPGYKRAVMVIYLFWSLVNIIFTFLLLSGMISLSTFVFKLCIILLLSSLFLPISYAFFIHSNVHDVLIRLYNFSVLYLVCGGKEIGTRKYEKLNEKISAMGRLTLHALHGHDEKTFNIGLTRISTLGKMILESTRLNHISLNSLFKNLVIIYCRIAAACINVKSENYLRDTLSSVIGLITYGISCKNPTAAKINFPIAVDEIKKLGLKCIESDMHPVGSEIIDNLAQVGDLSLRRSLEHPPAIAVSTAFQEIGVESAKKGIENFCLEVLVKIEYFAREILNDMESFAGSGREEEAGKVIKSALKSHWIVSAYLFKNIPETGGWLGKSLSRLEEEFKEDYRDAYDLAVKTMDLSSYVGKRILEDYRRAIKGEFFKSSPGHRKPMSN